MQKGRRCTKQHVARCMAPERVASVTSLCSLPVSRGREAVGALHSQSELSFPPVVLLAVLVPKNLGALALKASSWGISTQQAPALWKNGLGQSRENEPANKGWCPPPCCGCAGVRRGLDTAKSCVCPEGAILTMLAGRQAGLSFFTDLPSGKCLFAALDPWSRRKE